MNIEVTTHIARPIDAVWELIASDFTSIATWSASVVTSTELTDAHPVGDAPLGGRYCTFTPDPDGFGAREEITRFDPEAHVIEFEVEPVNAPKLLPLKHNRVRVELASEAGGTRVTWVASPELKAHGYMMYPMLKAGMRKSFAGLLAELKAYAESGERKAA